MGIQDPKLEVLYHIKPDLGGLSILLHSPYIGLTYHTYLQFRYLKWPLILWVCYSQQANNPHPIYDINGLSWI